MDEQAGVRILPILFNTDMVRAILDKRKSATRRVVKPQPPETAHLQSANGRWAWSFWEDSDKHWMKVTYQPGDVLYVRETWAENPHLIGGYMYRAFIGVGMEPEKQDDAMRRMRLKWRPSIHMPKEAARIFLRVTDVQVERLREITEEQAQAEGFYKGWKMTEHSSMALSAMQAFMWMWDYTIKPADRALYGWAANPWVWVIEFERCEKPDEFGH